MELDKRILPNKRPLTCLDVEQAKVFEGKECIFSDTYDNFKDIDKYTSFNSYYTAILALDDKTIRGDYVFKNTKNDIRYRLILPLDWVNKNKEYRPYTVMEFIKEYPLGSHLHFRPKDKSIEMHRLIDGYNDCLNGSGTLFMCGMTFSMIELYDNYDIFKDGKWQPFGIEED